MTSWRLRLEPALNLVFRTWWRFNRAMTLGVRGIVCDEAGRVLLVRHTYSPDWHFPGGGVERGETAIESLKRELAEEAGVVPETPPTLIGFYANHANFPNDHVALYRIAVWRSCPTAAGHEIAERRFFALESLPPDLSPAARRRIAEVFEGAPPSATW